MDKTTEQKAQDLVNDSNRIPDKLAEPLIPNTVGKAVLDLLASGTELSQSALIEFLQNDLENHRALPGEPLIRAALKKVQSLAP